MKAVQIRTALAAAVVGVAGTAALGQQNEVDDGVMRGARPYVDPGYVGNGDYGEREAEDTGDARLYAPSIGFDLPTRAEQYARAVSELRIARRELREAEAARARAQREHKRLVGTDPEVRDANRAVEQALDDIAEARRQIDEQLEEHPLFAGTRERAQELSRVIDAAHRRPDVTRGELQQLADQQLFYNQRLEELRQELGDMTAVEEARQRLREAVDGRDQAVVTAEQNLRDVAEVDTAEQQVASAQERYDDASVEYSGARAAYWEADARQVAQYKIRRYGARVTSPYSGWAWNWW